MACFVMGTIAHHQALLVCLFEKQQCSDSRRRDLQHSLQRLAATCLDSSLGPCSEDC